VESPKEPETLQIAHVDNKVPLSISARASQSAPPLPLFGRCFGDGDLVDCVQRVKRKENSKWNEIFKNIPYTSIKIPNIQKLIWQRIYKHSMENLAQLRD